LGIWSAKMELNPVVEQQVEEEKGEGKEQKVEQGIEQIPDILDKESLMYEAIMNSIMFSFVKHKPPNYGTVYETQEKVKILTQILYSKFGQVFGMVDALSNETKKLEQNEHNEQNKQNELNEEKEMLENRENQEEQEDHDNRIRSMVEKIIGFRNEMGDSQHQIFLHLISVFENVEKRGKEIDLNFRRNTYISLSNVYGSLGLHFLVNKDKCLNIYY
jgi:hypothetical protein